MKIDKERQDFFDSLLRDLNEKKALDNMILIGGWALNLYHHHYKNPLIPTKNTVDVDFLFRGKTKIKAPFELDKFLEDRGFETKVSQLTGERKFVNDCMDIDFLIPLVGKDSGESTVPIKEYHIEATKLRYLDISTQFTINIDYNGMNLTLPHPAAYTYAKFMVFPLRYNKEKALKDLDTAQRMARYLTLDKEHLHYLMNMMKSLPEKWNKRFMDIVKENAKDFYMAVMTAEMERVVDTYINTNNLSKDNKDMLLDVEEIIVDKNFIKHREKIYEKSLEGLKEKDIPFYVNSVLNKGKDLSVQEFEKEKRKQRKKYDKSVL